MLTGDGHHFVVMYEKHGKKPQYLIIADTMETVTVYIKLRLDIEDFTRSNFEIDLDRKCMYYDMGDAQYTVISLPYWVN